MISLSSLFGAVIIAVACLLFSRSYAEYIKGRAADYQSVLGFFELMHREISCRLAIPCELAARSDDSRLRDIGFLDLLLQGKSLGDAFRETSGRLLLTAEDTKLLQGYLDGFGGGSAESEIRSLDMALSELSARALRAREEAPARIKLVGMLSVLFALGIVVLLL